MPQSDSSIKPMHVYGHLNWQPRATPNLPMQERGYPRASAVISFTFDCEINERPGGMPGRHETGIQRRRRIAPVEQRKRVRCKNRE